ncbi:hypothetical protein [Ferruginibacter sp. SUN106]|uniref:hypothetical protein n=1 Tax=Ferruginibacter sp. SUN106 TaxID=2978348 RepID=UPI003D3644B4
MKALLFITAVFTMPFAFGQHYIKGKILDSITHQPLPEIYFYILKDHDKWIDISKSDSAGNFVGKIEKKEFKRKSTYQVLIDYDEYNPVTVTAGVKQEDTCIILLTKSKNYYPEIKDMIYKGCSTISFGEYEPKEPASLNDLPVPIQQIVSAHLINKAGTAFYSRLRLSGGQIVNLNRLQKIEHYKREYQWTPQTYYLCFSFSDTTLGIARYTLQMVLDSNGNIIEDIELPDIAADSTKGNLLSMQKAIEVAKANDYYDEHTTIEFEYDRESDGFTWSFSKSLYNKDHTYINKDFVIAAHNGKILKQSSSSGIWSDDPFSMKFGKLHITRQLR